MRHQAGKDITEQGGGAAGFHLIKDGTASVRVGDKERPDWARASTSVRYR